MVPGVRYDHELVLDTVNGASLYNTEHCCTRKVLEAVKSGTSAVKVKTQDIAYHKKGTLMKDIIEYLELDPYQGLKVKIFQLLWKEKTLYAYTTSLVWTKMSVYKDSTVHNIYGWWVCVL